MPLPIAWILFVPSSPVSSRSYQSLVNNNILSCNNMTNRFFAFFCITNVLYFHLYLLSVNLYITFYIFNLFLSLVLLSMFQVHIHILWFHKAYLFLFCSSLSIHLQMSSFFLYSTEDVFDFIGWHLYSLLIFLLLYLFYCFRFSSSLKCYQLS